ncbi:MAG: outer membrane protein assembly factor BamB [Pseudomonadota bacterium]
MRPDTDTVKPRVKQRGALRAGIAMLAAASLTACGTLGGLFGSSDDEEANQPAPLLDIVKEVDIKRVWSTSLKGGQGAGYYHLSPVIQGELIYAAGSEGEVVALRKVSGKPIWKIDLESEISGGVGVGGGLVLVGTSDGKVHALSDADGSELWASQISGEILSPPQSNGRVVVVQSYNGELHGLNAEDGVELWSYDSNVPVLTLRGNSTPIIYERVAIAGFGNGRVVAVDLKTGALRWEARVAIAQGRSEIDRIVDIDGTMLLLPPVLWAVSYQGYLAVIDLASGRKLRQEEVSSYAGLDQGFGNVYVAEETGTVIAYYRNTSGIRWEQGDLTYRRLSTPKTVKGYVVVGDFEGYLHFLSQLDGRIVGRMEFDGDGVRANMLAEDDILYVYGNSGKLSALRVIPRSAE